MAKKKFKRPKDWYEFARITDEGAGFDETCEVPAAKAMLKAGLLQSYDGKADHGYCVERFYTVLPKNEGAVWAWIQKEECQ